MTPTQLRALAQEIVALADRPPTADVTCIVPPEWSYGDKALEAMTALARFVLPYLDETPEAQPAGEPPSEVETLAKKMAIAPWDASYASVRIVGEAYLSLLEELKKLRESTALANHTAAVAAARSTELKAENADMLTVIQAHGETIKRQAAELSKLKNLVEDREDMLSTAWGIICNVSIGDWTKQNIEWREAAARFREFDYNRMLRERHPQPEAVMEAKAAEPFVITGPGFYRTRDGRKAEVCSQAEKSVPAGMWLGLISNEKNSWLEDGHWNFSRDLRGQDLIAPWREEAKPPAPPEPPASAFAVGQRVRVKPHHEYHAGEAGEVQECDMKPTDGTICVKIGEFLTYPIHFKPEDLELLPAQQPTPSAPAPELPGELWGLWNDRDQRWCWGNGNFLMATFASQDAATKQTNDVLVPRADWRPIKLFPR